LSRLLVDEGFSTATLTVPITAGWIDAPAGVEVELRPGLAATEVGIDEIALIPSAEVLRLQPSHEVVSDHAVVADRVGAVAMRTPVRPDDVESTAVRLFDAGGTAEILARATLTPFYGIEAAEWLRVDDASAARAEVVIVEGAEALREPEAGFSEDLVRAWFILTAQSFVSHLLVTPRVTPADELRASIAFLDAARTVGLERRREWRPPLAEREGIGKDRANAFWAAQRLSLEEGDRRALLDLLGRGADGSPYPSPSHLGFRAGIGRD
jgi:predicted solute-binding protein